MKALAGAVIETPCSEVGEMSTNSSKMHLGSSILWWTALFAIKNCENSRKCSHSPVQWRIVSVVEWSSSFQQGVSFELSRNRIRQAIHTKMKHKLPFLKMKHKLLNFTKTQNTAICVPMVLKLTSLPRVRRNRASGPQVKIPVTGAAFA